MGARSRSCGPLRTSPRCLRAGRGKLDCSRGHAVRSRARAPRVNRANAARRAARSRAIGSDRALRASASGGRAAPACASWRFSAAPLGVNFETRANVARRTEIRYGARRVRFCYDCAAGLRRLVLGTVWGLHESEERQAAEARSESMSTRSNRSAWSEGCNRSRRRYGPHWTDRCNGPCGSDGSRRSGRRGRCEGRCGSRRG